MQLSVTLTSFDLIEKSIKREENLEVQVETALNDIELKIESLKLRLEHCGTSLKNVIDFTRTYYNMNRSLFMLDLKKKTTEPETLDFARNLRKTFLRIDSKRVSKLESIFNRFEVSCEYVQTWDSEKVISPLEAQVVRLNAMSDEYNRFMDETFYESNRNMLTTGCIGKLCNQFILSFDDLERATPTILTLKDNRTIRGFCNINNKRLILADSKTNILSVMDEKFREIQRLKAIGKHKFEYPVGVCTDGVEYVYICDHDNNRVLMSDLNLRRVVKVLGKTGNKAGEFDCPIEICYHSNCVYVLDRENKRIQIYSRTGLFLKIFSLYRIEDETTARKKVPLILPICLNVIRNAIGVLSISKIFLYNHSNQLMQTLEPNNIKCFCFVNDKIYAYNNESNIICYRRNYDASSSSFYVEDFSIKLNGLKKIQASCMILFNEKLVVSIDFEKQIAVI